MGRGRRVLCLLLGILSLASSSHQASAQCGARIRKNWDAMTLTEKNTYKGALAAAMDSGAFIKFVEMHTEMMSEMEAHRQCMFIYWHRLLLVAFENMLRGQGSAYACVTIPYWDWITAQSRASSGTCVSLGGCSAITSELGGWTNGTYKSVTINGVSGNSGTCVMSDPLNHFCESGSKTGSSCVKCVPRGTWGTAQIPTSAGYASVRNQVFSGSNIGEMSPKVEGGCHNNIHANLAGTMGTFASPSDPIFWSHHAMIDALHTIFHKCRVGTARLTYEQKASNPVAWSSCERRNNGGKFNPSDVVTMRTGENGKNPIAGSTDSMIGKYFSGVPSRFADLMDVRDLGDSSYTYELSGFLATMYNDCDGTSTATPTSTTTAPATTTRAPTQAPATTTRAPTQAPATTTRAPTQAPATTTRAPTQAPATTIRTPTQAPATTTRTPTPAPTPSSTPGRRWWWWWPWSGRRQLSAYDQDEGTVTTPDYSDDDSSDESNVQQGTPSVEESSTSSSGDSTDSEAYESTEQQAVDDSSSSSSSSAETVVIDDGKVDVIIKEAECEVSSDIMINWYEKTMEELGGQSQDNMDQLEFMACVFEDRCLGGSLDYSEEFKRIWSVTVPRCKAIVDAFDAGYISIDYENWQENMEGQFGCPVPTTKPPTPAPTTESPKQSTKSHKSCY